MWECWLLCVLLHYFLAWNHVQGFKIDLLRRLLMKLALEEWWFRYWSLALLVVFKRLLLLLMVCYVIRIIVFILTFHHCGVGLWHRVIQVIYDMNSHWLQIVHYSWFDHLCKAWIKRVAVQECWTLQISQDLLARPFALLRLIRDIHINMHHKLSFFVLLLLSLQPDLFFWLWGKATLRLRYKCLSFLAMGSWPRRRLLQAGWRLDAADLLNVRLSFECLPHHPWFWWLFWAFIYEVFLLKQSSQFNVHLSSRDWFCVDSGDGYYRGLRSRREGLRNQRHSLPRIFHYLGVDFLLLFFGENFACEVQCGINVESRQPGCGRADLQASPTRLLFLITAVSSSKLGNRLIFRVKRAT